jgi:NADH-quinone oxidoreductase subunit N
MNLSLSFVDWLSISPMIVLTGFALLILLLEIFAGERGQKVIELVAVVGLLSVGFCLYTNHGSENPLLTRWLRFDAFSWFFQFLFLGIGIGVIGIAHAYFKRIEASKGEFFFLLLGALLGLFLISSASDFLTLFLGLETLSLALYVLCGYLKSSKKGQEASIKYFLTGAIATSLLLFGIALMYGATGSTHFETVQKAIPGVQAGESYLLLAGMGLLSVGLLFKATIVPFHMWAPDVYEGAPTPVTAFMSCATKAGAFAALAAIIFTLGPVMGLWPAMLGFFIYPTLIYANFVALCQSDLRRFFAYSGISHAGFLLIPLVVDSDLSFFAISYYLVIYVAATLGAFAVLVDLKENDESLNTKNIQGLFYHRPFCGVVLSCCLLTLAALPPGPGFFAKFYLFKAAFSAGAYGLVLLGLLTSLLSAVYYLRLMRLILTPSGVNERKTPVWSSRLIALGALSVMILATLRPDWLISWLSL